MAYQPTWVINAEAIFIEEYQWYYLTHSWGGYKDFYTFPIGISPKMNVVRLLEFELAYFGAVVRL